MIFNTIKETLLVLSLTGTVMFCSCATSRPPQAFHNTDNSALVIRSLDDRSSQVIAPTLMTKVDNIQTMDQYKLFTERQTAVVILEKYSEPQPGPEFRDRSLGWILILRRLGFQHIFFLQGKGVADPDGLTILHEF